MKRSVAWMAANGVAANLLLLFMIVAGILSLLELEQEVFPEFSLDIVEVRVTYPGATPEEMVDSIVEPIEERIEGLDGIKEVTSIAAENTALVRAELELGEDLYQRLDEVKAEIDRIDSFPEGAETPEVSELTNQTRVMEIALYGDVDRTTLKQLAYRVEEELQRKDEISFVELVGMPEFEISIEVPLATLRAYGLSLPAIAEAVRASSLDVPAGEIETRSEEIVVRVEGQKYRGDAFGDIVVRATAEGDIVRLRDIATIRDAFADSPLQTRFDGRPAVFVQVFRTGNQQVLDIAAAVDRYLRDELRPSLPEGLHYALWQDDARSLESRFSLLVRNGAIGLVLVLVCLTLFLDLRLALWVSAGILASFVATFAVMRVLDVSVNMLSLFGFILAIGIVVDDAIVVGENIFAERRAEPGGGIEAAVRGTVRVTTPVVFAVATTVIAFLPLLFAPGSAGKFLDNIPIVVVSVLALSLVESLWVLPHHIGVLREQARGRGMRWIGRVQAVVDRGLGRFVEGPLRRVLVFCTERPAFVLSCSVALLAVALSVIPAGFVRFVFFPEIESEYVTATLEMPAGTAVGRTERVAEYVARVGRHVVRELEPRAEEEEPPLLRHVAVSIGRPLVPSGPPESQTGVAEATSASVVLQLSSPEVRSISSKRVEERWRAAVGSLPGVESLTFSASLVDFGADVQVEIAIDREEELDEAVASIRAALRDMAGVVDVKDDLDPGKRELEVALREEGRALGLTQRMLADQLRAAFFGIEAERMQRGPEEVRVYVRLPPDQRGNVADLYRYRIRTPDGEELPLREVARVSEGRSPTNVRRREGRRIVTIQASVNPTVITGQEATQRLRDQILPGLEARFAGLAYTFGGEQREQREFLPALLRNFLLALLGIYTILAVTFRSYTQPLVVMAAIPFGFVGAVLGHLVMGLDISMLSLFGIVGLAGVIVNDSLVMVDFINERVDRGVPRREAVVEGAQSRFRPILLTSLTTFLGVFPLVVERSIQAQFLVPLAVSVGFGVLVGTAILMVVVTALAELELRWREPSRRAFDRESAGRGAPARAPEGA